MSSLFWLNVTNTALGAATLFFLAWIAVAVFREIGVWVRGRIAFYRGFNVHLSDLNRIGSRH